MTQDFKSQAPELFPEVGCHDAWRGLFQTEMTRVDHRHSQFQSFTGSVVPHVPGDHHIRLAEKGLRQIAHSAPGSAEDGLELPIRFPDDAQPRDSQTILNAFGKGKQTHRGFKSAKSGAPGGRGLDGLYQPEVPGKMVVQTASGCIEIGVEAQDSHSRACRSQKSSPPRIGGYDAADRFQKHRVVSDEDLAGIVLCECHGGGGRIEAECNGTDDLVGIGYLDAAIVPGFCRLEGIKPVGDLYYPGQGRDSQVSRLLPKKITGSQILLPVMKVKDAL